jgi:hypothetical protein
VEIKVAGRTIEMQGKALNALDRKVISFVKLLSCDYVIVSGYIALLFGRPRTTEDVDIIANIKDNKEFDYIWKKAYANGYYCINGDEPNEAYGIILEGSSVRFAKKGAIFPNFELKLPRNKIGHMALDDRLELRLGKNNISISPIELQIAYKLYLGSDKDYEDARYLYMLLYKYLDLKKLKALIKSLRVEKKAKIILGV